MKTTMKKITISLIAVTAVFALTASSFAQTAGPKGGQGKTQGQGSQERRSGGGMRMGMGNRMVEELKLTPTQKTKWEAVQKEMMGEMRKLMSAGGPGGTGAGRPAQGGGQAGAGRPGQGGAQGGGRMQISPENRQKMMAIMQKYQPKFMAILDDKQKKAYQEMIKKQQERWQKAGGAGKPGKGGGGKINP
jgi:Spy/CpxP family protein refolding chaperone